MDREEQSFVAKFTRRGIKRQEGEERREKWMEVSKFASAAGTGWIVNRGAVFNQILRPIGDLNSFRRKWVPFPSRSCAIALIISIGILLPWKIEKSSPMPRYTFVYFYLPGCLVEGARILNKNLFYSSITRRSVADCERYIVRFEIEMLKVWWINIKSWRFEEFERF